MRDAVSDVLGVNAKFLSEDFLKTNLDLIAQAA
jgi:hypothetical protein